MNSPRAAIWVFGAIGSGKSTVLARALPSGFRIIDQDVALEEEMLAAGLPFDTRLHNPQQRTRFAEMRQRVAATIWSQVPRWREEGVPLAFETTGDKPVLFRAALTECRAAGYLNIGVALRCPLAVCQTRNNSRRRILQGDVVAKSWSDFESFLADGTYAELFGPDCFRVVEHGEPVDLASQIARLLAAGAAQSAPRAPTDPGSAQSGSPRCP